MDEDGDAGRGDEEIIHRLAILGLDRQEASVYLHLTVSGPSKAADVARALGTNRSEMYRILERLQRRGFATATLTRPARFAAAKPEKLFEEALQAERARMTNLERERSDLLHTLARLGGRSGSGPGRAAFKVLHGRRDIYVVLERMIRDATGEVRVVSTHDSALALAEIAGVAELCERRAREGIGFLVLLKSAPSTRALLPPSFRPGSEVRLLDTDRLLRYVIVDERELLLWVVSKASARLSVDDEVAIWTDAPDFVGTETVHFESLWRGAEAAALRSRAAAETVRTRGERRPA